MPQRLFDGFLLLRRALRNPAAFRLRLVVARLFNDPVHRLYLDDIQSGYRQPRVHQHPVLDFLIGCLALGGRHIHVIQGDADADVVVRALLGQRNDRLDMMELLGHIDKARCSDQFFRQHNGTA